MGDQQAAGAAVAQIDDVKPWLVGRESKISDSDPIMFADRIVMLRQRLERGSEQFRANRIERSWRRGNRRGRAEPQPLPDGRERRSKHQGCACRHTQTDHFPAADRSDRLHAIFIYVLHCRHYIRPLWMAYEQCKERSLLAPGA